MRMCWHLVNCTRMTRSAPPGPVAYLAVDTGFDTRSAMPALLPVAERYTPAAVPDVGCMPRHLEMRQIPWAEKVRALHMAVSGRDSTSGM